MTEKRRALGRGLAALIPVAPPAATGTQAPGTGPAARPTAAPAPRGAGLRTVGIEDVHPWREQPRRSFDDEKLRELAETLKTQGVVQPLLVREREGGGYQLIDGERRWRAAQRAGLHEVPVVVRNVPAERVLEMSLVSNLQREDLNAIELGDGYQRLIDEFGYTQDQLAQQVGKDRTTVTNVLRLRKLPAAVRDLVISGQLQMAHARAILGLDSATAMEKVARRAAARQLSARQVESLVQRERRGPTGAGKSRAAAGGTSARDLAERLQRALGTRVKVIESGPGRGHLEIHFGSLDQLDAILKAIL